MKASKLILMAAMVLTVVLAMTGCMNSDNQVIEEPVVTNGPTNELDNTGDVGDANTGLNDDGNGSATPFDWTTNAAQVETRIDQISEVSESRVVVTGTTALVAVKYTSAYQGETTERIREMIAGIVREADPTIQTVAVTSTEGDVEEVYSFSDKIRGGTASDSLAEDINRIVRNTTTLR